MVYLKLQKYRQHNVTCRPNAKLSPRYYGPFEVVQRIGRVAYKLKLPLGSLVHPIFPVSCLKKCLGPATTTTPLLPPIDPHGAPRLEPERILQRRMTKSNNRPLIKLLVKWSGESEENST